MVKKRHTQIWSCRLDNWDEAARQQQREEALKNRQLGFVEDARELAEYIRCSGCSQEDCARKLGRSQSSVANRLRLLKLPKDVLETLEEAGLSERHGRALLKLKEEPEKLAAIEHIVKFRLGVAQTEKYIESLLTNQEKKPPSRVNLGGFLNNLTQSLSRIQAAGIGAVSERRETEAEIVLTITIPK